MSAPRSETASPIGADDVIDAATRLGDEPGPHALTMRRLADSLGVAVTSIYWHVGNRDDVLAAVVDRMLADMGTIAAHGDTPAERIESLAHQLRARLLEHSHLVGLVHDQARTAAMFAPVHAAIAAELAAMGCRGADAARLLRALQVHVVGAALLERSVERLGERRDAAAVEAELVALGRTDDPALDAALAAPPDRTALFDHGLRALLATVAAGAAPGSSSGTGTRRPHRAGAARREVATFAWGDVELRVAGDGAPLVVLHRDLGPVGLDALVADLAVDHTVLVPSLPGFGASTLPAWARSVAHLGALVGRVLDERAGSPADLVGLGFGGWVAAELAAFSPARVRSLVLVSPMGVRPPDGEVVDQWLFAARDYAALAVGDASAVDALLASYAGGADPDELLDRSREAVTRVAWKPIGHDPALAGLLAGFRLPSALVWGDTDAVVPPATATAWAHVLGTEAITVVPGAPHLVEHTHPAAVAAAVRAHLASAGGR